MKRLFLLLSFVALSQCWQRSEVYSIIASKLIRPHSTYDVILQSDKTADTLFFNVSIGKYDEVDDSFTNALGLETISVQLEPNTQKKISFEIQDLFPDQYDLGIEYQEHKKLDPIFNSYPLLYVKSHSKILIQTDKGIYKPGDKFQFRILALNENDLPNSNSIFTAFLTNADGYRIKEWANHSLDSFGHFQDSFEFSENVALGKYVLTVQLGKQKKETSFELKEYVLPLFSVDITIPSKVSREQPEMPILISSKYTHGKNVRGTANVKILYKRNQYLLNNKIECFSVDLPINGQAETVFNPFSVTDLMTVNGDIQFEAIVTVTESTSGMAFTEKKDFKRTESMIEMKFAVEPKNDLIPGIKFINIIKGTTLDGKPFEDTVNPVEITISSVYNKPVETFEAYFVNGTIPLVYDIPLESHFLLMKAVYKKKAFYLCNSEYYPNKNSIEFVAYDQVNLVNNKIKFVPAENSNNLPKVKAQIRTSIPIERFSWIVFANQEMQLNQLVTAESKSTHEIEFDFIPSLHRGFQLIAYYMPEKSSRWVFAEARYDVSINQLSDLQISSSIQTGKPGDEPTITVEGLPETFIALLGVDKSNMLLKKPTLIDEKQYEEMKKAAIEESLEEEDPYQPVPAIFFDSSKFYFVTNGFYPCEEGDHDAVQLMGIRGGVSRGGGYERYELSSAEASFEDSQPQLQIRKDFPETWIWADAITDPVTKKATFKPKIPDSITTWILNAFGVNTKTGLSVAHTPYELTVFNNFFIKANLPYSVVRDEVVTINVLVYNYLGKHKTVQVTLHNELGEFLFVKTPSELISEENELEQEQDQARQTRSVQVAQDEVASVSFLIRAKQVGHIKLQMVGQTEDGLAGDKVEQLLLVKPEGEVQRFNKALLISLKESEEFVERVPISIPSDVVPSSSVITVDAIADVLGSRLDNLDDLVRMPYGCGEQNMAGLVPNIVAMQYLTKTNQLTDTIKRKVIKNLESGYVRQLKYQHHDGGFSAFGKSSYYLKEPSTWLTAYVVNWFSQASSIITVDKSILGMAIRYLLKQINSQGHVIEKGYLFDKRMSGGVGKTDENSYSIPLDAFVLISLNQAKTIGLVEESSLNLLTQVLESFVTNYKQTEDTTSSEDDQYYTWAIVSAALNQVGSSKASKAFEHLWTYRKVDANHALFFENSKKAKVDDKKQSLYYSYLSKPNSHSVEATAYALSVLTSRKDVENGLRVIQWLISKQNSNGGWSSTQDTVVAMNALAQFAAFTYEPNTNLNVNFASKSKSSEESVSPFKGSFDLTKANSLVLQKSEWNERGFEQEFEQLKEIEVKSKGVGTAIVQVSWQYNVAKKDENNVFTINHKVNQHGPSTFEMEVCAKYSEEGETNMAIVSVETPSGFEYDSSELNQLRQSNNEIQRIDVNSHNNQASFYFNSINKEGVCFKVTLNRINCVYNLKPALINVYDYYQTDKATRYFYEIPIKIQC